MRVNNGLNNLPTGPHKGNKPVHKTGPAAKENSEAENSKVKTDGFLPVKDHPIGEELRHYYVDSSQNVPERVYFKPVDADQPLPSEQVRLLLDEINRSIAADGDKALKAQSSLKPEVVLNLLS